MATRESLGVTLSNVSTILELRSELRFEIPVRGSNLLSRADDRRRSRHYDIDLQLDQLRCQACKAPLLTARKSPVDLQVLAFDVAELAHSARERSKSTAFEWLGSLRQCQEPDAPDALLLSKATRRSRDQ